MGFVCLFFVVWLRDLLLFSLQRFLWIVLVRKMSFNSPGQGSSPWSAFLPMQDLSVDAFLNGGVRNIPLALVPTNGGEIRRNNPRALQVDLQGVTQHFRKISEARPFGSGGILCRSSDEDCVMDLLACSQFSSMPVTAFTPPHLHVPKTS